MGCRRCLREVTALLRDIPGVETVVADATTSRVRLGGTMGAREVLEAFGGSAYAAVLLDTGRPDPPAGERA
jgi:copper chaperone CopZ